MNAPNPQRTLTEFSPLTELARRIFGSAKALSPMNWLRSLCPLLKPRSEISPEEVASKDFTRRRAKAVEIYIIAWLTIEAVLVALVCVTQLPTPLKFIVGTVVGLRIVEIVQVTVNAAVFDSLSGRPDNRVTSSARMLVLAFVNFVELWTCFGVVYAADYTRLKGAGQAATAFYLSIITQLTIGYGDVYPTGYLRSLAAIQGLVSIVFIVLVFTRFVSTLPHMKTLLEEPPPGERAAEQSAAGDADKRRA